jgi:hypothetical protein
MPLLQGTKKLFGPLLDGLDGISAIKEVMELKVEAACDAAASRNQEAVRPSVRWPRRHECH